MAKGDDIEERLICFAVSVLDLCEGYPKTFPGTHIGNQLIRSATSATPNNAEARGCESMNDFILELGIVLKELNEARLAQDGPGRTGITAGGNGTSIQGMR